MAESVGWGEELALKGDVKRPGCMTTDLVREISDGWGGRGS